MKKDISRENKALMRKENQKVRTEEREEQRDRRFQEVEIFRIDVDNEKK